MRFFDQLLIASLYKEAALSHRKRAHHLMHSSHQDKVQRLFIAMIKGSIVEPHFHKKSNQWEMFCVLEGEVQITFHEDDGKPTKVLLGGDSSTFCVEVHPGEVHSVICLSDKALLLEIKEGPFIPDNAKEFVSENGVM